MLFRHYCIYLHDRQLVSGDDAEWLYAAIFASFQTDVIDADRV